MKKIILILCMIMLSGCGNDISSSDISIPETTTETVTETTTETVTETTTETVTETTTETTTETVTEMPSEPVNEPFQAMTDIEVGEPDETYYANNSVYNALFFDDSGRYYGAYMGERDGSDYILSRDHGNGEYSCLENAEDFYVFFNKDGIFYGYHREYGYCTFQDGEYTLLTDLNYPYFTADYIYFLCENDTETEVFRMKYDGTETETVAVIDEIKINKLAVHDSRIFYEIYSEYDCIFGVYDMDTGEKTVLNDGEAGVFCGDYMYYIYRFSDEPNLFRMNLNDYSCEKICDNVRRIAFFDGYIIYMSYTGDTSRFGKLYRLGKGENIEFFDANELFGDAVGYYAIDAIQSENGHLFIQINSGPCYRYIAEIDIDGNLIEKIYESTDFQQ